MRLGIFGGTFDPPHIGHLIVADDAAEALRLDRVCFIPAGEHPLKGAKVEAPVEFRARMIRAATASSKRFAVDERECRRPGPSYTIDTLVELARERPEAELFLLVGGDVVGEMHRWHRIGEIGDWARVAIMSRAKAPVEADVDLGFDFLTVEVTHIAISSSEIRQRVRSGRPFRYLVPEPVYEIIVSDRLYRDGAKPHPRVG